MCRVDEAAPDVLLYKLMSACHLTGTRDVAETKHITCTSSLALHLSREVLAMYGRPIDPRLTYAAYGGMPVKQVWHQVNHTALSIETLSERQRYLENKANKRRAA